MDASASSKVDTSLNELCGFFLRLDNSTFPIPLKQKNTVIKYTKLPDVDLDLKVSWPRGSYTLPPRLRRIITLDDLDVKTSRSLNPDITFSHKTMTSNYTKRKIVTISEDEENDLHPKFSKGGKRSATLNKLKKPSFSNRAVGNDFREQKQPTKTTSKLLDSSKYIKESKSSVKTNPANNKKDPNLMRITHKSKTPNVSSQILSEHNMTMNVSKERVTNPTSKSANVIPISISRNLVIPSEKEKKVSSIKNKMENLTDDISQKKPTERSRQSGSPSQHTKSPTLHSKTKVSYLHEIKAKDLQEIKVKNKPVMVIHVPLDETAKNEDRDHIKTEIAQSKMISSAKEIYKIDCGTEMDDLTVLSNMNIGTDPLPKKVNQATEMESEYLQTKFNEKYNTPEELIEESFGNLEVPNVSLTNDKHEERKKETAKLCSQSLPNLNIPSLKINPNKHDNIDDLSFHKSSYIIGRATLTYTTKQKINFQVVSNDDTTSEHSPSPLAYPMNVVSVFKKEMKKRESSATKTVDTCNERNKPNFDYLNGPQTFNCSYGFNNNKLVKPSEIISTIRVNNGLLHSEYICEQFQRELNFIDSFFESLQYLENCSLSNKCFSESKSFLNNTGIDLKQSEYNSLLSKIENGTNIDDSETMASKSLCLLNLLIRDEQRRAKNLLFVLKMREDALKDFTKSQILWLENKKKQENTDISTLKKKQRGALLKLQHECGEMQRMRKALLTLSEKRKAALMKTKKNIELKLKSNVNLEQILLEKKKLKRSITGDRNVAPLKCFDLSSSGCDESTTSRPRSDTPAIIPEAPTSIISNVTVTSAEKCIQTGESILGTILVNQATNTAAENFVVVDGGYLNILFQNLSLPQIFSSGKQYEVNEEALKSIVTSANINNNTLTENDVVEKFMDQIKHPDLDKSSTPSTARSLVDEFDQYYKGLGDDDKSPSESPERDYNVSSAAYEIKDVLVQATEPIFDKYKHSSSQSTETITNDSVATGFRSSDVLTTRSCACEISVTSDDAQSLKGIESAPSATQTGPLPVPVGATAVTEAACTDLPPWLQTKSSSTSTSTENSNGSNQLLSPSASSLSSLASPAHCEAEELRRQQLAIEREIKALEQQQCQLLVVREIPDKPPPPYTPPSETRVKTSRMFLSDDTVEQKVRSCVADPHNVKIDANDAFDVFVKDFCRESSERQKSEQTDKPWDACNLLPQKQEPNPKKILDITASELNEVLTKVPLTLVSGVSTRRSDHIDDILFAEWRRCEPEWTSLHADEVLVKNQVFESIFQKVLTETVDEYKKTVLGLIND